jgi:hypothetical protein
MRRIIIAAIVATAIVAAACGGGTTSSDETATTTGTGSTVAGTPTSAASLTTRSAKPIDTPVSIDARSAPVADGLLIAVDALQLQFTVPLTLSDLTLARIAPLPNGFAVGFSTRTLEAMEPDWCGAEHSALGWLRLGGDPTDPEELVADLPQGKVYYFRPTGPCAGDRTTIDLEGRQITEFRAALDTIAYVER